jgi:CheY-like chemotaxis protein
MRENCTILWAEDDQDDIHTISEAAQELGVDHLIDFVTTGEAVLTKLYRAIIHKTLPGLIVLDNNMPVMSGAQVLKRILEFEQLQGIPVAFFTTAKMGAEDLIATHHAQLFIKPATYSTYLETIKQIVALSQ